MIWRLDPRGAALYKTLFGSLAPGDIFTRWPDLYDFNDHRLSDWLWQRCIAAGLVADPKDPRQAPRGFDELLWGFRYVVRDFR